VSNARTCCRDSRLTPSDVETKTEQAPKTDGEEILNLNGSEHKDRRERRDRDDRDNRSGGRGGRGGRGRGGPRGGGGFKNRK
jgi:lupus La protein